MLCQLSDFGRVFHLRISSQAGTHQQRNALLFSAILPSQWASEEWEGHCLPSTHTLGQQRGQREGRVERRLLWQHSQRYCPAPHLGTVPVANTIIPLFRNIGDNLQSSGQEHLTPLAQVVTAVGKESQKYHRVAWVTAGLGGDWLGQGKRIMILYPLRWKHNANQTGLTTLPLDTWEHQLQVGTVPGLRNHPAACSVVWGCSQTLSLLRLRR